MSATMASDLTILGGGSWGTALAIHLSRCGRSVTLWVHDAALADRLGRERTNAKYLPGHPIPASVRITPHLGEALDRATDVLLVVPSHHCRRVLGDCRQFLTPEMSFCSASKGIESDTLLTVSQVIREVLGADTRDRIGAISGPSFADEVASGHPTAVVVASSDPEMAARLQARMSVGTLRVYTNSDLMGVELGGALKNVIAIAAGAVAGLGYGSNTVAALITRGLAEMSRLGVALGGRGETLAGLAGLGDLVLTCTGRLSRNRALGAALASGAPALTLAELQEATPMVVEGVRTTLSAHRMAQREGVDMPITGQVHAVLYGGRSPADAIRELLGRQLTKEDQ